MAAESLQVLEGLMSEFFSLQTTNERKRNIEELLNNFSQQRDAWKHCLFFMANTKNEYVLMYCTTVLENIIIKQWIGLTGSDRAEIRNTLNTYLLEQHDKVPTYVRNKLVKLIVDIGRIDWPHFYPDFFTNIMQLIQQSSTSSLGLILLLTTSEELACPREDLSVDRKQELQRLLLQQIPAVLSTLNDLLESVLEKHRHLVTATPPPSPTQSLATDNHSSSSFSLFSSSGAQRNLLSNMFNSPNTPTQADDLAPLDAASRQISAQALNCLTHLFSWIPLSSTITPSLLSTIFHFAALGCDPKAAGLLGTESGSQSVGELAMTCINELLAKNCVPVEFEDFLLQMFQQTFFLLQRLTKDSSTSATGNRLTELDESYIDKFTEFLRLFVSIHLRRFESNCQFPVMDFLALLFRYTFKQPTDDGYFNCLDIWGIFIDYLSMKLGNRSADKTIIISRYSEALTSLINQILNKIQFQHNQVKLEELDDETLDDDEETEWQHYLRQNLEIIAKASELMPAEIFKIVFQLFSENLEVYLGMHKFTVETSAGRQLSLTEENECRRLHCVLRDLSSSLQALGRLSHHFIGEFFIDMSSDGLALVQRLIEASEYGTKWRLYEVKTNTGEVLKTDFIEVHAQAIAAVKAFIGWLSQFNLESQSHEDQRRQCIGLINRILDTILPLFDKRTPQKISHSAAHLLLSLLVTVRPNYLLGLESVQSFYNSASQGMLAELPIDVQLLIYRSLSHYLVLPWPGVGDADQGWADRSQNHQAFVKQLLSSYRELQTASPLSVDKNLQLQAKPVVQRSLKVLTDFVETISESGVTRSKQMMYVSIQDHVQFTLTLFPVYIHSPDVSDCILGFYLALFLGLRGQMGIPFTEQVLQTFMALFTRDQLSQIINQESAAGNTVVEKFLKILQVIVQEPGSSFRRLLPNIITVCMDQIYPVVAERPSADIKPCLYELLHELLQNNWRFFFKQPILNKMQASEETIENEPQFTAIMQSFGQSFLQPDITVFRQNLEALENLNSKWKLYHRKLFRERMLSQFLTVLLQVLVLRSHDLLQEEIGITAHNMAAVDFEVFYKSFMPQFIASCEGLDDNQRSILEQNFKPDKDLPSFINGMRRFVNDLRYYRLCNASLPEGSVKL